MQELAQRLWPHDSFFMRKYLSAGAQVQVADARSAATANAAIAAHSNTDKLITMVSSLQQ